MDTFFSNEFLDMLVRFLICVLVVWIIIDRFEGDITVVEPGNKLSNAPRAVPRRA